MKVVALAGGTGSAKLLRGLHRLDIELTVVANTGDNAWMYGVYVCPDIDIACYSLAGIADPSRGWGIEGDTYESMAYFERLGLETWFRLGDRDLATCIARTHLLRQGATLTEATDRIRKGLAIVHPILPASDRPVETMIDTPAGELGLQEYWVREKGTPKALRVRYKGAPEARATEAVARAIRAAERIVVCPANPVTSVGPMLAIPGFTALLSDARARITALSPMLGGAPFSGPAGKLLKAAGQPPGSRGVAGAYAGFLDALVIHTKDFALKKEIESLGMECILSETKIRSPADETRLARELLEK